MGLDLVDVRRVRALLARHRDRALRRLFTDAEIEFCSSAGDAAECFAARLAAKEAAFKALGTGVRPGVRWRDVEVVRQETGKPELRLSGAARLWAERLGTAHAWVSLSHEGEFAGALVLLESR